MLIFFRKESEHRKMKIWQSIMRNFHAITITLLDLMSMALSYSEVLVIPNKTFQNQLSTSKDQQKKEALKDFVIMDKHFIMEKNIINKVTLKKLLNISRNRLKKVVHLQEGCTDQFFLVS